MKKLVLLLLISFSATAMDFEEKYYERPVREVSLIVTDSGFYPDQLVAHEGEKLKFFVTSTSKKSQCLVLQKHELFMAAEKGSVNEGEVVAEYPGKFKFYCPSFGHEGWLTVVGKNKAQDLNRKPASAEEEKPKYWIPRDYDRPRKN